METSQRLSAVIAYIPVIGWLYVPLLQRTNKFAKFHVRQSIGLFVFLVVTFAAWVAVSWVLTWIPLAFIFGVALFTIVVAAFGYGIIAWIIGIISAARGRAVLLPIFGKIANQI